MNYRQLEFFLAACEELSFSQAANKLFISQQGLSQSINQLEEDLGVPLFIRSHSGLQLTEYGEALQKYATPFLRQHDYIFSQIQSLKTKVQNTLSVGFASGMGDYLPKEFFSNFINKNPDIDLQIKSFDADSCTQSILDYRLSMGFSPLPIDFDMFDSQYSERKKLYIIMSKYHPLAHKKSIHMEELKKESIITLNAKTSPQDNIMATCHRYGIEPRYYLTGAENKLIFELCLKTNAVSFFAGHEKTLPDDIVAIQLSGIELFWEIHLITNKNIHLTEPSKKFINYTKEKLR